MRTRQLTGGGKCLGAVALVDDLTDQIHAEAQQEQIERARFWRELAAGVSHEIRNPLVAIKTLTQLLPQRYTDESFRLEFREMVSREVGRLDNIVTQIEGFAHPAPGVIDRADLTSLLQEAADGARAVTEAVDAQIKIDADEGLPAWHGDSKAMVQCFQHLFVNSIEAAANRKVRAQIRVRLVANRIGQQVTGFRMAIVDNGPGIAPTGVRHRFFAVLQHEGAGHGAGAAHRATGDPRPRGHGSTWIPAPRGCASTSRCPCKRRRPWRRRFRGCRGADTRRGTPGKSAFVRGTHTALRRPHTDRRLKRGRGVIGSAHLGCERLPSKPLSS